MPIPVAVRSKACVCSRFVAWDRGLESCWGHGFLSLLFAMCCVGSGLCEELITRWECYLLCVCVCVCVCLIVYHLEISNVRRPASKLVCSDAKTRIRVSAVSMATWLWAGRSGVRIPFGDRDCFLIRNVQFASMVHPIAYSGVTGLPAQGSGGWGLILTSHLHAVPSLRMSGALPLLTLYACLACTGTPLPLILYEGKCVLYNSGRLTSWCILSLFVGLEAGWIPNKVLVWVEIRNSELMGRHCFPPLLLSFILRPDAGRLRSEFDTGREINSEGLRAGREVCGTVITADTAFW